MPWAAARHCPHGHPPFRGRQCPVCHAARRAKADKGRPSAARRGYGKQWQKARHAFLARPENAYCACGCGRPADVVDHIVAHKGDMGLFWDRSNWQPMNRDCNSRKAARSEGGFGRPSTASEG